MPNTKQLPFQQQPLDDRNGPLLARSPEGHCYKTWLNSSKNDVICDRNLPSAQMSRGIRGSPRTGCTHGRLFSFKISAGSYIGLILPGPSLADKRRSRGVGKFGIFCDMKLMGKWDKWLFRLEKVFNDVFWSSLTSPKARLQGMMTAESRFLPHHCKPKEALWSLRLFIVKWIKVYAKVERWLRG